MVRSTVAARLVALAATVYAAVALARAPAWTVDDAFIVARYAEHVVRHGTIAWNVGEPPVEGFSSVLSVAIAAVAERIANAPVRALVLVDEIAFLASGVVILAIARALRLPLMAGAIVAVVHLTMAEHLTHATSGLETELFVTLGLVLASTTVRAFRRGSPFVAAIVAFLLCLTRPEGIVAGIAAMTALVLARRSMAAVLGGFGAPLVGLVAWRWHTFHALVPNTFYAKEGAWNLGHLKDLGALVADHCLDVLLAALVALVLVRVAAPRRPALSPATKRLLAIAFAVIALQSLAYARSEPIMAYSRRFAMHDLAWVDVIALVAIGTALRSLDRAMPRLRIVLGALFALALLSTVFRGVRARAGEAVYTSTYARGMNERARPTAEWLAAHAAPDATLAVHPDAGIVPYLTRRRTIDFGLLNDATLARAPHSPAVAVAYFFDRSPDYFVVADTDRRLYDASARAILSDPRFVAHYELVRRHGYAIYARSR